MILSTAALCLALNIYHEARGEPERGQYAVALVTMNRAEHDRRQVCKTVLKPKQFSWTQKLVIGKALQPAGVPKEQDAWANAKRIANDVLNGQVHDFTKGAIFFHRKGYRPYWRNQMVLTSVVGSHLFYRLV